MNYAYLLSIVVISATFWSCSSRNDAIVQVGENTFVFRETVYRVIENQVTKLGYLSSDSIPESKVFSPELKNYGAVDMSFIKADARCELLGVYRGDVLYFKLELREFNDLKDRHSAGHFTLNLLDNFGFQIHAVEISLSEMIGMVGSDGKTVVRYEYDGKTQMSSEMYKAITRYSVAAALRERSSYGW